MFKFGKWYQSEQEKRIQERYGENSRIVARSVREPMSHQPKHSFDWLLGKKFPVAQTGYTYMAEDEKEYHSFKITNAERRRLHGRP